MAYIDREAEPSYDAGIRLASMAAPTPSPGQTLGHFRLIEEIGAGAFGIVYRARDTRLERDVAVKVLNAKALGDDSTRKRFRREALILSRLNHPNIETVYDFHSEKGVDYLVIEYVPGISLCDRVEKGALPEQEVLALGIQLTRGLAAAHAQRIIHRDLKPGNLKVTPDKVLKILDFGLAQLFSLPEDVTVTETEVMSNPQAGTPAYLSPEQVAQRDPDTRSDIYSTGVVLYEMATGSRPFPGRGQMLTDAILHSLPPAPRLKNKDLSPGLEAVILKCLEKDPNQRYQSANALLEDLEELARVSGPHRAVAVPTPPPSRARRWIAAGVVLIALAAVGIGFREKIRGWLSGQQASVQQKILAMLPIEAVGQDPATTALGLGLTETVTAKLVQASDNDAIQLVSPRDLRDKGVKTAEDARREFGTDLVLECSLQRFGHTIRINCSLVDSRTHRQVDAKSIEAETTDPFGLQDKVMSAALDMLPARINREQRRKLNVQQDTQPTAYEAYVRGRGYLQEYEKPENIYSAVTEFERAIQIDPNYAPAYAGLGDAYWTEYQRLDKGSEWVTKASSACTKSLSLSSDLVEGHICLGNLLNGTGKYAKAAEEFKRAVASNGQHDEALRGLAEAYTRLGDFTAAESTYKKAIELRPNYWAVYSWLGLFYYGQARYSEAAAMFERVTQLAPDNYQGYLTLGGAYGSEGRYQEAVTALKRSIDLRPTADAYTNLGYVYTLVHRFPDSIAAQQQAVQLNDSYWMYWGNLGDALYWSQQGRGEAAEKYRKAISLGESKLQVNSQDAEILAYLANYSAMLNERQAAFEYLQRALKLAPSDGEVLFRAAIVYNHFNQTQEALSYLKKAADVGYSRAIIKDTPDFEGLQQNSQFRSLVNNNL